MFYKEINYLNSNHIQRKLYVLETFYKDFSNSRQTMVYNYMPSY